MIKIGITGSLASGKSSVAKILKQRRYPLFDADKVVKSLYSKKNFIKKIRNEFKIPASKNYKHEIKNLLIHNNNNLKRLEKLIHPIVRKKMYFFFKSNSKKKFTVCEIPLLIESKLMNKFDKVVLVTATRKKRKKRYINKGGNNNVFTILDKRQIKQRQKIKHADYVVNNNSSPRSLKEKVKKIINEL
tara:strand:- start:207 stop:770 length:564 start_codon:yes stop_codon:yes gene_type:complete